VLVSLLQKDIERFNDSQDDFEFINVEKDNFFHQHPPVYIPRGQQVIFEIYTENPQLIEDFTDSYRVDETRYTQEYLIESAKENNIIFKPGCETYSVFGDEQGTLIGEVFDYILRSGGSSKNFTWRLEEYLR